MLRGGVNPVYITCIDEIASSPFHPQQLRFIENPPNTETIVKANLTSLNIRPASGRAFVRVWSCGGGFGMPSSKSNLRQNYVHATQTAARLRVGKFEGQVLPGGGCA